MTSEPKSKHLSIVFLAEQYFTPQKKVIARIKRSKNERITSNVLIFEFKFIMLTS